MDRLVIALVFNLDEKWIGGGYYIRNVVSALGKLPAVERPSILMISDNRRSYDFIAETGYPDLTWLTREQFDPRSTEFAIDATFPWALPGVEEKAVSWIPDLQEHHLPAFFSKEEIEGRQNWHRSCFQTAGLILSSQAVLDDVDRFYPNQGQDKKVVHFATFDTLDKSTVAETVERYDLGERYVLCPNQLWIHKNHVVALDALRILKQRGKDISLYFTGNDHDHRAVGYSRFLKQRIADWGLTENVRFLGFLPRGDQLALMSGANYILQPSLFEGWSTVIEDAKAMSQFVLASDLDVHKEQLNTNFELFDRSNPQALADAMERLHDAPPAKEELDYSKAQQQFGRDFVSAVAHFVDGRQRASGISFDEILRMTTKNLDETVDDKSDNPAEPTSIAIEPKKSPPLAKKKWPALKSSNELDGPIPATRVKSFPVNFFTMLSRSFDRTWYRRTYGENVSTKPLAVLNAVLKLDRSPTPFFDP
ncbi:MAG: glycosyltransferase, partial [Pseudomonadota bacterium]